MGCCSTTSSGSFTDQNSKLMCPGNNKLYKKVSQLTVLHNLRAPWKNFSEKQTYYFCDDPGCDVIYFSDSGSIFQKTDIRTLSQNTKSDCNDGLICYCFGVSTSDYSENQDIRDFVVQQTKIKNCACEIRNPSGKCCLKDFPRD